MYSSAMNFYMKRANAGRCRSVIDQPILFLFATAVSRRYYEILKVDGDWRVDNEHATLHLGLNR